MSDPPLRGMALLHSAAHNKSTAFTDAERDRLGLRGLLPAAVGTQKTQLARVLANLRRKDSDIEKYIFLAALQGRNERLFYRLVIENFQEMMPLIYTPTVGQACKEFATIFRSARGFYVTPADRGRIRAMLDNWPHRDVRIIVVTDGERILGLGDLGANGMGIPIGKLGLYCACAGIHPQQTLPVMLDVGTGNEALRTDPVYLGTREPRLRGEAYLELVDEFIEAVNDAWPGVLVQFEDFAAGNAYTLLGRYRDRVLCFNDDIQGTAAVVLAGILAATRISGVPLAESRFVFLGAGSAATGIGSLIAEALVAEGVGRDEAYARLWFFNRGGLVTADREGLPGHVRPFAHALPHHDFLAALEAHAPHFLIGATGTPATFTPEIVGRMAALHPHPGIFALSNPTSRAECTAEEAYRWSGGRAIFTSGSPFPNVHYEGRELRPGQGNNAYIFPGVGLGMLAARARTVPDTVFLAAARALAESVGEQDLAAGALYPVIDEIRAVSLDIAVAVAEHAFTTGLADGVRPDDLRARIQAMMYDPVY